MKVRKRDVAAVVAAAFPDYRGRRFRLHAAARIRLDSVHWDGGSRNEYVAVHLATGRAAPARVPAPWFVPSNGIEVDLPVGSLVVEHSVFCGKDAGITVHSHPANLAALLPAAVSQ